MAITTNATLAVPSTGSSTNFTWVNAQVLTSSAQTVGLVGFAGISQVTIYAKTTSVTGTSPTLDLYIQKLLADGLTWQDIAHFSQITSATGRVISMVTGGNKEEAQQSAALAAATVNAVAFGGTWRLNAVIAGTSPSFTLSVYVEAQ